MFGPLPANKREPNGDGPDGFVNGLWVPRLGDPRCPHAVVLVDRSEHGDNIRETKFCTTCGRMWNWAT